MDLSTALLAALLCAEVAAVGLAIFHEARRIGWPKIEVDWRTTVRSLAGLFRKIFQRPLVLLLTFALADELAQAALHAVLDGASRPLAGWYRAGWHVSIALSLGWPAALAWGAMVDKSASAQRDGCGQSRVNRRLDPLLGAYLGALAGLAIVYPPSRAGLRWTLLAWELACVALAWWGLWRARRRTWGAVEVCLVVLVACESAVCVVGPFASDPFTRWWIARAFYLGAWGLVCGVLIKRPS